MTIFNVQRGNTILKQQLNNGQKWKRQWDFHFLLKKLKIKKQKNVNKIKQSFLMEKDRRSTRNWEKSAATATTAAAASLPFWSAAATGAGQMRKKRRERENLILKKERKKSLKPFWQSMLSYLKLLLKPAERAKRLTLLKQQQLL